MLSWFESARVLITACRGPFLQLTYSNEVALLIKIIHGVLGVLLWDGGLHTWTGHCRSLFIAPL